MHGKLVRAAVALALIATGDAHAQSGNIAIVSAASYGSLVSPDSLVSVFGANLALTAQAQLDSQGQLPTVLGGISVQLNGVAMPLVYTSASQINFYAPPDVAVGGATVVVRTASGTIVGQGQADVRAIAPALFTADSSGRGRAAVQNAVTYGPPPFLVETPEITGDDKRTRLVLYGTGFRAAAQNNQTIHALGRLSSGASVDIPVEFPVEYAGPTPGFFGLDQLNLVLPPEMDGAGTVRVTLFLGDLTSNEVTFDVSSLPAGSIQIGSISLPQSSVISGQSISGTITLNAPARLTGLVVSLRTDSNSVQVPLNVTIPAGQVSAPFTLRTSVVTNPQTAHLTASTGSAVRTASLRLDPVNTPSLVNLQLSNAQVTGGSSLTGTVGLSNAAPFGGTVVDLKTNGSVAQVPATVTVPAGQTSASFAISTVAVPTTVTTTLTASAGDVTRSVTLTVSAALSLSFANSCAVGGTTVAATVAIGQPAPAGGAAITISSNNAAVQVPGIVRVGAGQTTASFTIPTTAVVQPQTVLVTATYNGEQTTATLTLMPSGSTTLASVSVSPSSAKGGTNVSGAVTLAGPAPTGGVLVSLQSNNLIAQIPPSVMINSGQSSATFSVHTSLVVQPVTVIITAVAVGQTKTTTLTITP